MKNVKNMENKGKKLLWEKKSEAYNSMFDYLEIKGLNEVELITFSKLLLIYIELI